MNTEKQVGHAIQRLEHRLTELAAWQNRANITLGEGRFQARGAKKPTAVREGDPWPSREFPASLEFEVTVPNAWAGLPVAVRLAVGGEAKLTANGKLIGGLNPYHTEHPILEKARGRETLQLKLEVVPKGLFGTPNWTPRLETARLLVPDLELRAFLEDLAAAHDAANQLHLGGRFEIAALIVDALEAALKGLGLPASPSENYLARVVQEPRVAQVVASIWDEWRFGAEALELPAALRRGLPARRKAFKAALERIEERYPSEGKLFVTGHAHIDLAWLWPFEETRRKCLRTFGTMLSLMERYPNFHFNQSSAQAYAFVEADDPDLFKRIQARVKEGRWDIVGGMWVEPDGNLLSGESWARQVLYGQRYFRSRFGKTARVCWLPDTFGYTPNLPQILRQAGIPFFFTTKLNWNETNTFPHDLYHWEGIDGSRVIAHSFLNPGQGYNGNIAAFDLLGTWKNFKGKRHFDTSLFSCGWGDGGGGPTQEMLERFDRLKDFPGLPKLETGRVEELYRRFEKGVAEGLELPVWVGEQYLELHRGTYTTQSKVKWYHRRLEHVLPEAEAANALAWHQLDAKYPQDELYAAWTTLLRHHFHDVLPGSSVHAVYEAAHRDLGATLTRAEGLRDNALEKLSARVGLTVPKASAKVVVWNLTLEDRPLSVRLPKPISGAFKLIAPDGLEVPYQFDGDEIIVQGEAMVPGLGYLALAVVPGKPKAAPSDLKVTSTTLENSRLRVTVNADGTLESVFDKRAGREVLAGRGNQIHAYTDIPREWDAWEIDANYTSDGAEILAASKPKLEQRGPLEAVIRVERKLNDAIIESRYRLRANSSRLEIETRIHWQGRRTMLRALFPLNVRHHEAWFETAFGAIARPTHQNTSWDAARFEVNAHCWADLSEAGYGVSLLNDGKYGHSAHGSTLGLTLLRSPVYPDPYADEGEHHFSYALLPHQGDWRAETIREAHDLNAPLRAVVQRADGDRQPTTNGDWPTMRRFLQSSHANLRLSSFKKAEDSDELILRVFEAHGGRGTARVEFGLPIRAARRVNLLEEEPQRLVVKANALNLEFTPYSVSTLKLS